MNKSLTVGRLFLIIVISFAVIYDSYYLYTYGSPFTNNQRNTIGEIFCILTIVSGIGSVIGVFMMTLIKNWNKPLIRKK